MTQTMKEEKASKDLKKTESTRTLIHRIKAMKASKEEPMTEKANKMEELPKIEALRSENEGNKNNVDKKLWNAILCGLRKKTRNLNLLLDKLWRLISIVGQNTEIFLNNINSYNNQLWNVKQLSINLITLK